jgi:hypothetical protein
MNMINNEIIAKLPYSSGDKNEVNKGIAIKLINLVITDPSP